jgi:hypothetical protein
MVSFPQVFPPKPSVSLSSSLYVLHALPTFFIWSLKYYFFYITCIFSWFYNLPRLACL